MIMKRTFKREMAALEMVDEFIQQAVVAWNLDEAKAYALHFVAEELFTNAVKYNPEGESDILIDLERKSDKILLHLLDHSTIPFNPAEAARADTTAPLQDRKIGGLGLHLSRKMVDDIVYKTHDDLCEIIVTLGPEK